MYFILSAISFLIQHVHGNCYYPNGTDRNSMYPEDDPQYSICSSAGTDFGMCCAAWDTCRDDGLCQNDGGSTVWRESCTDPLWQSPRCLRLCTTGIDDDGVPRNTNDEKVTQCLDGSWCCGQSQNSTDCCNQGRGVMIVNGQVQTSTTSTSSTPAATSATPSTISSATPPPRSSSTNTGAIAGGVVGGVVGLALLFLVALILRRRHRRSKLADGSDSAGYGPVRPELDVSEPHKELDVSPKDPHFEMEQPHIVNELDGQMLHDGDRSSAQVG